MGWLGAIVIGLIVGLLARMLTPGRQRAGIIVTVLIGIGGSLVATLVGQQLGIYEQGETAGFIASLLGAIGILAAWTALRGRA